MNGCLGNSDDKLTHCLILQLGLHNTNWKLPFTVSNSPTIENMEMSLGQIRCGLNTDINKITAHSLALREDVKTEKVLGDAL